MGAQEFEKASSRLIEYALKILDGLDPRSIPRYSDEQDPLDVAGEREELAFEKTMDKRQQDWLAAHHLQ